MKTTESMLVFAAGDYLRARGSPVTPKKVESYVREQAAQQGTLYPGATPSEIVTATNALMEQANITTNARSTSMGKTRMFSEPRKPDGSGGRVLTVEVQPKSAQQYALPQDYFAEPRLDAARRAELESELAGLRTQVASAGLTPVQRIRIEQSITHLERILGKTNEEDARRAFAR